MKPQLHSSVTYSSLKLRSGTGDGFKTESPEIIWSGQNPPSKSRTSWRRLGRTSLRTLFVGSLVLPLIFILLGLLWVNSIILAVDQDPGKSWVNKLSTEWTTRIVTISTALIRTAVDFQATLATAMIAAIMLERVGVPLHKAPFYSMTRAVDVAPSNLLLAGRIRFKRVTWATFLIYTLITVEVLVTIASQFLSTIFLSDFSNAMVPRPFNETMVPIFETGDIEARNVWLMSPSSSWTFAEVPHEPLVVEANFHDTGHTYRGLLPLENDDERPLLRKFTGPLPIIDFRVACVNPRLSNLKFEVDTTTGFSQPRPLLVGDALFDAASYPMLRAGPGGSQVQGGNFSCPIPTGDELDPASRQLTLCWPISMNGLEIGNRIPNDSWNISMVDRLVSAYDYSNLNKGSPVALVVDVIDANDMANTYNLFDGTYVKPADRVKNAFVKTGDGDGPWAVLKNVQGVDVLRVTACFTELGFQNFEANVQSSWDVREPRVSLSREARGGDDINSLARQVEKYGTEAMRRQLGATLTPDPFNERGILTLEPRSEWRTLPVNKTSSLPLNSTAEALELEAQRAQARPWYFPRSLTHALLERQGEFIFISNTNPILRRPSEAPMFAHQFHVNLFQDTLNKTNSPALALQAMLARITQMMYYDKISQLNDQRPAVTSFATSIFLPVRWTGFIGAVVIVATHLAIVIAVTILFLKVTTHSLIGGYWQAISQVVTEDTIPILEHTDAMEDKQIKTWSKEGPGDIKQNSILRRRENGRVALSLVP